MRNANYPYKKIEESGYIYPIIKTELNYYSPLFYDDLMYIYTRPGKLEMVKLQFDYLITSAEKGGEICCTGFTRHCAVNSKSIPVEIDEQTIKLWNEFPR
jgi:acyl-CoA thioester hydrolase